MCGDVSLEIILVRETPPAHFALVPDAHMSVLVVVPVLPHRVEALIAVLAPVPELVQVPEHVLFHVFLVHERSETEVADGPVRMVGDVVLVEFAVFGKGGRAHVAVVNIAFPFLYVSEEDELVDKELFAPQAFVVRNVHLLIGVDKGVVGGREVGNFMPSLRLRRSWFRLRVQPFTGRRLSGKGDSPSE